MANNKALIAEATDDELVESLVFARNFKKPGKGLEPVSEAVGDIVRSHPCNANCDCYVEIELAQAAGIGGYRLGM